MEKIESVTPSDASREAAPPRLSTDVVIIGGGLAGSLAGAMLGRAGIDCIIVDPHRDYPPDFRCEKLDGDQVARLQKTGLADEILSATTFDGESWVARMGMVVEKRPGDQHGIFYAPLVNRVRCLIPATVRFCYATARGLVTSRDRQTVTLSDGTTISARLAVLSNGLGLNLRDRLGLTRECLSHCHSVTVGFNIVPVGRAHFDFPALTVYAKVPSSRTAYITLFPIGNAMRANLFVYRPMDDPWLAKFRAAPEASLRALMPELERIIGAFTIETPVQIRPADLSASQNLLQPGVVLVGDAFATTCPAAGNGARKVITDVERLCNRYIPQWLATEGMDTGKIAAFYADPVKRACDRAALRQAFYLRNYSIDTAPIWRAQRLGRFLLHLARGMTRRLPRAAFRSLASVLDHVGQSCSRVWKSWPSPF